jgi:hypothetical protein
VAAAAEDFRKAGFLERSSIVLHIALRGSLGHLRGMTIRARVHNGTIVLPEGVEIADGAEVQVIVPEKIPAANGAPAETAEWLRAALGKATSGLTTDEIMQLTRGEA